MATKPKNVEIQTSAFYERNLPTASSPDSRTHMLDVQMQQRHYTDLKHAHDRGWWRAAGMLLPLGIAIGVLMSMAFAEIFLNMGFEQSLRGVTSGQAIERAAQEER